MDSLRNTIHKEPFPHQGFDHSAGLLLSSWYCHCKLREHVRQHQHVLPPVWSRFQLCEVHGQHLQRFGGLDAGHWGPDWQVNGPLATTQRSHSDTYSFTSWWSPVHQQRSRTSSSVLSAPWWPHWSWSPFKTSPCRLVGRRSCKWTCPVLLLVHLRNITHASLQPAPTGSVTASSCESLPDVLVWMVSFQGHCSGRGDWWWYPLSWAWRDGLRPSVVETLHLLVDQIPLLGLGRCQPRQGTLHTWAFLPWPPQEQGWCPVVLLTPLPLPARHRPPGHFLESDWENQHSDCASLPGTLCWSWSWKVLTPTAAPLPLACTLTACKSADCCQWTRRRSRLSSIPGTSLWQPTWEQAVPVSWRSSSPCFVLLLSTHGLHMRSPGPCHPALVIALPPDHRSMRLPPRWMASRRQDTQVLVGTSRLPWDQWTHPDTLGSTNHQSICSGLSLTCLHHTTWPPTHEGAWPPVRSGGQIVGSRMQSQGTTAAPSGSSGWVT